MPLHAFPQGTSRARLIGMLEPVVADGSIAVKRYRNVPLDASNRLIPATGLNETVSRWMHGICRSGNAPATGTNAKSVAALARHRGAAPRLFGLADFGRH
jgi:hypothetical protein